MLFEIQTLVKLAKAVRYVNLDFNSAKVPPASSRLLPRYSNQVTSSSNLITKLSIYSKSYFLLSFSYKVCLSLHLTSIAWYQSNVISKLMMSQIFGLAKKGTIVWHLFIKSIDKRKRKGENRHPFLTHIKISKKRELTFIYYIPFSFSFNDINHLFVVNVVYKKLKFHSLDCSMMIFKVVIWSIVEQFGNKCVKPRSRVSSYFHNSFW